MVDDACKVGGRSLQTRDPYVAITTDRNEALRVLSTKAELLADFNNGGRTVYYDSGTDGRTDRW